MIYVERDVEREVTGMLNVMYDLYYRLRLLWNHECDGYDEQQSPAAATVPRRRQATSRTNHNVERKRPYRMLL